VTKWQRKLNYDPIPPLLASEEEALTYFVRRDLLGHDPGPVTRIWQLPAPQRILKKELPDGSWPRAGVKTPTTVKYPLVETWRNLRFLVEQYGFTREHPQAAKAAEFVFSCQTEEGDIRGFIANQYATYYTGALMAVLIHAGYADDPRIEKGLRWLLSMRQDDLAWSVPLITHKFDRATLYRLTSQHAPSVEPDRSKPFSHNATGMVLRAFAAHPEYRHTEAARTAAHLLASRFFKPDSYTSYRSPSYWVRFEYPFWWNHLVAALDTVSLIGLGEKDEQVRLGLTWLIDHQERSGLWKASYVEPAMKRPETAKTRSMSLWVSLAICRVLRRYYG
jgi:hypothetical protein